MSAHPYLNLSQYPCAGGQPGCPYIQEVPEIPEAWRLPIQAI